MDLNLTEADVTLPVNSARNISLPTAAWDTGGQVAVIVVTWNQRQVTMDCLESLALQDYPSCQIIVVDNGSKDGTSKAILRKYPHVTVLENNQNLGFVEGSNRGIQEALAQGASYVLLLNNDTVVDPHMVSELVEVSSSDSRIGIVGPTVYYHDRPDLIWNAGNKIEWDRGTLLRLFLHGHNGHAIDPYEVDYVAGCALFIKREVIEAIGLLDPRFFIYYEESDWCARASAVDYKALVVPTASVWHKVSAAMGEYSPATVYYMSRNVFLFLSKNLRGGRRSLALARTSWRELRTIASQTVKPGFRHLRAQRDARVLALRDAMRGSWGKMGSDVAAVCASRMDAEHNAMPTRHAHGDTSESS